MVEVPDFKVGRDALASSKRTPNMSCALALALSRPPALKRRIKPGNALLTTVL